MAEDRFKEYFTEKIWEMIPAIYRHEDGLADKPYVLRRMIEIIAEQAANVRRSHDRLWEDQFIELCNEWAVPYIADLVGTRLVSALNNRARKVDVAKTIYYRRRKGTLAVLEELISDITGWDGHLVEGFRRLARTRHGLDQLPNYESGRFTGTLPGGIADLRSVHAAELSKGPFEEYYHTPDLRKPIGEEGHYGIQRLLFYLYRIRAFKVTRVTPFELNKTNGKVLYTFDPSGRDIPLYMPRNRPYNPQNSRNSSDWGKWRSCYEWELPAPMRCRLLGHAEYQIRDQEIIKLKNEIFSEQSQANELIQVADELNQVADIRYKTEISLRNDLNELPNKNVFLDEGNYNMILNMALVDKCGKQMLYPDAVCIEENGTVVNKDQITSSNLSSRNINVVKKKVLIDPENGRLMFTGNSQQTPLVTYHYGYSAEIGAGTYNRKELPQLETENNLGESVLHENSIKNFEDGGSLTLNSDIINQINDSRTYHITSTTAVREKMSVVAANRQRPYVLLENEWILEGKLDNSMLLLNGLWVGTSKPNVRIILRGDYKKVSLNHMTIDPGGLKDRQGNDKIPTVVLEIEAKMELLVIESSILGPIIIKDSGYVEQIIIKDSIIHSIDSKGEALTLNKAELHLERVTVIGNISAQNLWATDLLLFGIGHIFDTQSGCFRFSAAKEISDDKDKTSRLPRQYRSIWIEQMPALFTSIRFGDPGYMQLTENCPDTIVRGAENRSEMGAYNKLINPVKYDGLRAKVEEYMPFGLLPVYIFKS